MPGVGGAVSNCTHIIAAVRKVGDNKVAIILAFSTFFNLFLEPHKILWVGGLMVDPYDAGTNSILKAGCHVTS